MVLFCDCLKGFIGGDDQENLDKDTTEHLLSSGSSTTELLEVSSKKLPPRYRCVNRHQCRLLYLLCNINDSRHTNEDAVDRHDWYDVWERCDTFPREAMTVDSYTGRCPLHLAALVASRTSTNDDSMDESNADHAMWEQVIETLVETNPHALITLDKHNYTPLHLLCNLSNVVRSNTCDASSEAFHFFPLIMKAALSVPRQFQLEPSETNTSTIASPITPLAIVSTLKKPSTQTWFPPPPLLLACRKNASAESLYWILMSTFSTPLSWVAPWTGGETIQEILALRKSYHVLDGLQLKMHWHSLESHETPLETLLLVPDNQYGKRVLSMVKLVADNEAEQSLWRDIAEQLYSILPNYESKVNESSTTEKFFQQFQRILRSFLTSPFQEPPAACVSPVGSDAGSDVNSEPKDEDKTHVKEMRHLWVKTLLLIHQVSPLLLAKSQDYGVTENDQNIRSLVETRTLDTLVLTVTSMYRPITELLYLVCTLFPEQLCPVQANSEGSTESMRENEDYCSSPLHFALLWMPMYQLEEKKAQEMQQPHLRPIANTNSSLERREQQRKSALVRQQKETHRPQKVKRKKLYMHTRFTFGIDEEYLEENVESGDDGLNGLLPGGHGNLTNVNKKCSVQQTRIMETQIRILVEFQPDALFLPIQVTQRQQRKLTKAWNDHEIDVAPIDFVTTQRKGHVAVDEPSNQPNYYPIMLAAANGSSLDTIFRMIVSGPQVIESIRGDFTASR